MDDTYLDSYARGLGITASAVYMSLCRHADRGQECFPAQQLIAREHSISIRSVKRAIKRLKEANIIAVRRERLGHGRWRNNVYVLLDKSQWVSAGDLHVPWTIRGQKRHRPGDNNDRTKGHHSPTKETHKKVTHIKDIEIIDIFSLNEEGGWIGRGNMRPLIEEIKPDDISEIQSDNSNKVKVQKPEGAKRKLTEIRAELSERLGWENKEER